jgi:deoxyribonuclease IV
MSEKIRFGTSGNPPNFFKSKFGKDRKRAVDWIKDIGLNHYELLMTYGARTKPEVAEWIGERARELGVSLSVHAPYYVVLSSHKKEVRENSIKELVKTLKLAELMGAKGVVFHPGFNNHNKALENCIKGIKEVKKIYKGKVKILPETMGLKNQLGSLEEIIEICLKAGCEPCIDFAHVHAKEGGSLDSEEKIKKVLFKIKNKLGKNILRNLHCHFYPVEYSEKGEKKHRAYNEKEFHPLFENFAPLIKKFNMAPTLVSESRDSQDLAALEMKKLIGNLR